MAFSEAQLETWSHQGSVQQSAATYRQIKNVLEEAGSPYAGRRFSIFLQGSYSNDTNVYSESDVDVVIRIDEVYYDDKTFLNEEQTRTYDGDWKAASYTYDQFKADVVSWLKQKYGSMVVVGTKAITVRGDGSRRDADVLVAAQFRRYQRYVSGSDNAYHEGICFWSKDGARIENFPRQHSANLTSKHQQALMNLKPHIRILKNMRNRMVDRGSIKDGLAPSYYLEGLYYNVPPGMFRGSRVNIFTGVVDWLRENDKTNFVCANELYYLLREGSPVTWRAGACEEFLDAIVEYWRQGAV